MADEKRPEEKGAAEGQSASSGTGLFHTLFEVFKWVRTERNAEAVSLKALADKKFIDLDYTHNKFFELLLDLRKAAKSAASQAKRTDNIEDVVAGLEQAIEAVSDIRREGAGRRRAGYEEANVYRGENNLERGIWKGVPGEVEQDLRVFMDAYCQYFQAERQYYNHDVAIVIAHAESRLRRLSAAGKDVNRGELLKTSEDIVRDVSYAEELLAGRWQIVAASYHVLGVSFRRASVR